MAVRGPNGQVRVTTRPVSNAQTGIRKIWFVRGVLVLVETLVLGSSVLFESANVALGEEEEKIAGPVLWGTLLASLGLHRRPLLRGPAPDNLTASSIRTSAGRRS